jgi:hypothetical protein
MEQMVAPCKQLLAAAQFKKDPDVDCSDWAGEKLEIV